MQPQPGVSAAPPAKRKRVVSTESEAAQPSAATTARPPTKKARLASDLSITAPGDGKVLEVVESRCDVQIHSVISSSKIQKKVSSVLRHLAATSASPETTPDQKKPRVSVLRARASDAGKLVSIAEIAKRELAAQGEGGDKERWFQYIGLGQELKETPKKKTIIQDTILNGKANGGDNEDEDASDDENETEKDDFEYMKTPFERAIEGRPKKQAIAIISLFLARVSVDELKKKYGEQSNQQSNKTKS
ncbi:hypothetical protein BKA67DRAFT_659346 [Truncatella angustata]|uniref:Uncharacterized protein n=1 Tax=Truncatella angustata TaxID=152316 RepID=A0A9P8UIF5_9PEZI|nr:uncharacterized protein BKA67DRAFT_659346 [Truncatella angustata]KAH6652655.1 hypothetical protein BKA67DRAFT_659346 [Truncatella angustata]KAH8196967.1 hypothetical protein TruAng_008861 [Truncatella angustata]